MLGCVVLRALAPAPIKALLPWSTCENLEPADLDDGFNAIRIVLAGEKPANALYDFAAYVGCSFSLFKVSTMDVDQKSIAPPC